MRWTDGVVKPALSTRSDACGAPSLHHPELHQIQQVNLGGVFPPFSFNVSLARGEGEGDFGFMAKILHYHNCNFYTLKTEG